MAYRKQRKRILAGSLNLLAPADMTPEGDSLALENWRVDQFGQLRSRRGADLEAALSGTVHTLFVAGNDRYAGVGTKLLRGTAWETELASDLDGNPIGMAAYMGFVWVMNANRRAKVAGSMSAWGTAAPAYSATVAATIGGPLKGEYTYYITFSDVFGHESSPSPASNTVTCDNQMAELTDLPPAPEGITTRHIYRIGGGVTQALRIASLGGSDAEFWDVMSDSEAQAIDIELEFDHDPPPAAIGLVGPYYGKLIAYHSADHPNRIWWTPTARPWYFPGSDDDFEGNWVDVGDDDEEIASVTHHGRMLMIYKRRSIWRLLGDPDENDPERTNATVAIMGGPRAVVSAGTEDYYLAADGVYRFNGDTPEKVSHKIDPIFQEHYTEIGKTSGGSLILVPPMDKAWNQNSVMGCEPGRVYLSYPRKGTSTWNEVLVYETTAGRWSHFSLAAGLGISAFGHQGGNFPLLYAVGSSVYESERGLQDGESAIPLVWQSGYDDQGLPDNPKMYADLVIDYRTAESGETPATLNVSVLYDHGNEVSVGTLNSGTRTKARFKLGIDGKGHKATNIAVRIAGNASSTVTIVGVYIHYYALARQGMTFDTGVFDLGIEHAKLMDRFELDVECAGTITWTFYTDLPSGVITQRDTGTFSPGANRRTIQVPIGATGYYGRRGRLVLTANQALSVHALRIRALPIGVYLDGSQAEVWLTQPMTLGQGAERLWLFREIELLAESSGAAALEIFTETPGYALAEREEFALTATTGRRPFNFRLPGTCRGQTLQCKLTPGSNVITMLLQGSVYAKPLGTQSAWAWYPIQMLPTPPEWAWVELPVDAAE